MNVPKNKELYEDIKKLVYQQYPKHSLFRSALLVKEYKKLGGEYEKIEKKTSMNIPKWFNQNWISIPDYYFNNEIVQCGSSDTEKKFNVYPLCRPKAIVERLTRKQMKQMMDEKNNIRSKPLQTEKVLKTKKYNIKTTRTGI
jgi:hypothetical protein